LIDTIKDVEEQENNLRQRNIALVKQDELQSRVEELTNFANQLVGQFQASTHKSILMKDIVSRLTDSQRGVFRSKGNHC